MMDMSNLAGNQLQYVRELEAEVERLKKEDEAKTSLIYQHMREIERLEKDLLKMEARYTGASAGQAAYKAKVERLEAERDDYKDRWEILGRVSKNMLDKADALIERLKEDAENWRKKAVEENRLWHEVRTEVERLKQQHLEDTGKLIGAGADLANCQRVCDELADECARLRAMHA